MAWDEGNQTEEEGQGARLRARKGGSLSQKGADPGTQAPQAWSWRSSQFILNSVTSPREASGLGPRGPSAALCWGGGGPQPKDAFGNLSHCLFMKI